jgi:hypothetical protein
MRRFVYFDRYYYDNQIKGDEMCVGHGKDDKFHKFWSENIRERDSLIILDVNGRIILKSIT